MNQVEGRSFFNCKGINIIGLVAALDYTLLDEGSCILALSDGVFRITFDNEDTFKQLEQLFGRNIELTRVTKKFDSDVLLKKPVRFKYDQRVPNVVVVEFGACCKWHPDGNVLEADSSVDVREVRRTERQGVSAAVGVGGIQI